MTLLAFLIVAVFSTISFFLGRYSGRVDAFKKLFKDGDIDEETYKKNM